MLKGPQLNAALMEYVCIVYGTYIITRSEAFQLL